MTQSHLTSQPDQQITPCPSTFRSPFWHSKERLIHRTFFLCCFVFSVTPHPRNSFPSWQVPQTPVAFLCVCEAIELHNFVILHCLGLGSEFLLIIFGVAWQMGIKRTKWHKYDLVLTLNKVVASHTLAFAVDSVALLYSWKTRETLGTFKRNGKQTWTRLVISDLSHLPLCLPALFSIPCPHPPHELTNCS